MEKYLIYTLMSCVFIFFGCKTDSSTYSNELNNRNIIVYTYGDLGNKNVNGDISSSVVTGQNYLSTVFSELGYTGRVINQVPNEKLPSFTGSEFKEDITTALTAAASQVGDGGTLYWIHNGHGADTGELCTHGDKSEWVNLSDAMTAIQKGLEGKPPLKRLVMFVLSCFSGEFIQQIPRYNDRGIYQEVVIFTLASTTTVGAGYSLEEAMNEAVVTLKEAMNKAKADTEGKDNETIIAEVMCSNKKLELLQKAASCNSTSTPYMPSATNRESIYEDCIITLGQEAQCPDDKEKLQLPTDLKTPSLEDLYNLTFSLTPYVYNKDTYKQFTAGSPQQYIYPESVAHEPLWP